MSVRSDLVATVLGVTGVLMCSIVVDESVADIDRTDLASGRNTPEARGLISITEDSRRQTGESLSVEAVISIEATNAESIRWYAHEILGLDKRHPSWDDMERQIAASDAQLRMTSGRGRTS